MREIKFRLLKDGNIVGYEKHVLRLGIVHIFHSILDDSSEGWEWNNITHDGFIYHDDKEQYIGRVDKNGNEIYEGSVCSRPDGEKCKIIFYANSWCMDMSDYYPLCREGWCEEIKADTQLKVLDGIHKNKS